MSGTLEQWEQTRKEVFLRREGYAQAIRLLQASDGRRRYTPEAAERMAEFSYPLPPKPVVRREYLRADKDKKYRVSADGRTLEMAEYYLQTDLTDRWLACGLTRGDVEEMGRLFLIPNV